MSPARLLDDAFGLAGRRPAALIFCGLLAWLPLYGAGFVFAALIRAADAPPRIELLGVGTLAVAAWMSACWASAAGLRICAGEATGAPLRLSEALWMAADDVPRALSASAVRGALTAAGLLPVGAGFFHARVLTAGLLPASVLDRGGLRAGLALSVRASRSFALVQLLTWIALPLFFGNLTLLLLATAEALDPLRVLAPLQGQQERAALLLGALLSPVLAEPIHVSGLVAAWEQDRRERLGGDLLRRLQESE